MSKSYYKSRAFFIAALLILTAFTIGGSGCRVLKRDKQAIAEKKTEEANKKADQEYENALKIHYNHQSKAAKKMMKQTKKQAAKVNKPKKRKWFAGTNCK